MHILRKILDIHIPSWYNIKRHKYHKTTRMQTPMFKGKKADYKLLGICHSKVTNEDVRNTVDSICSKANEDGWKVLLFSSFSDLFKNTNETKGEASIYRLVNAEMLDALVVMSESIQNDEVSRILIDYARSAGIPVLTVDKEFEDTPCILFDYTTTFEKIVRHVIEDHGCRKVNFIAGFKDNPFSDERLDCYKRVLAENGITYDERRVGYGNFWEGPTVEAMDNFMKSSLPFPEAIICCNDTMAITVCQYLSERKVRVPDDVIVTGFDGIELERYYRPRITTASVDFASIGIEAMNMIETARNGGTPPHIVRIPYKIRISQSCGCENINSEDPYDKILELYKRVNSSAQHESVMLSYLRNAAECGTLKEVADVMSHYGDYCEWFCVNTDLFELKKSKERYHDIFTETSNAFLVRFFDTARTDGILFPTRELLPDLETALERHDILFFSPLHFREEVMGYTCAAICFTESVFSNRRRYITNTTQILENLINRVRLERVNAELAEMHIRDPLTGLYNRRGFYKRAEKLSVGDKKAYVFSIDMDYLKYINDNFGHNEGDAAIKAVASALHANGRDEICSRFGGDEFTVIGFGDDKYPEEYVKKVRDRLNEFNAASGKPYKVGISCGWDEIHPEVSTDVENFIRTADFRMYDDKRRRKKSRDYLGTR